MSPHQCCKLSIKDPQRGVDNEIYTIYNLAETETLVLELKPYLKLMKQDTRPFFKIQFISLHD